MCPVPSPLNVIIFKTSSESRYLEDRCELKTTVNVSWGFLFVVCTVCLVGTTPSKSRDKRYVLVYPDPGSKVQVRNSRSQGRVSRAKGSHSADE
uniref:Uncharacterized protein n=1 Tax=Timema poppense TaxID=170557 RepID=A0A7R9DMA5_TIMPO|nr:unnamed protein product [Timema poppensis]